MSSEKQATWGGRFSELPSEKMIAFGESVSFDAKLAPFDIQCSKAHSAMLQKVGILTADEKASIHQGLDQVLEQIISGQFEWKQELGL